MFFTDGLNNTFIICPCIAGINFLPLNNIISPALFMYCHIPPLKTGGYSYLTPPG